MIAEGRLAPMGGSRWERRSAGFWVATIVSGAAAIVFAFWGWTVQLDPIHAPNPILAWESVGVRSIQALGLAAIPDAAAMKPDATIPLGLAQLLGAFFYLAVAGRIFFFALGSRFAQFVIANRRGHDLIIGAGNAAVEYARAVLSKTTRLSNGFNAELGRGAKIGRAGSLRQQLQRAGAGRAKQIVVDEGEDAETWQTAQSAAKLYPTIDVIAHIGDPWVHERLSRVSPEARLRTFCYASGAARQIMLAHPPFLLARRYNAPAQHILIFGFGPVGQSIAREFLVTSVSNNPAPMMITAIEPDIEALKLEFAGRMPSLGQYVDLEFLSGDHRIASDETLTKLQTRRQHAEVCAIYVAIDSKSQPLSFGYALRDRVEQLGFRAPIFICAQHGAGLTTVRHGAGLVGAEAPTDGAKSDRGDLLSDLALTSFGSWNDALDGSGLFEKPEIDAHAKAYHEGYRASDPGTAGGAHGPSNESWERLADEYRVANRRAAAHIRCKLDAAGFDLETWLRSRPPPWRSSDLPAAAAIIDPGDPVLISALADLEHRRWMLDRSLNGWRYGAVRDDRTRVHPDMQATSNLSELARAKDRASILQTVDVLCKLGG
jgi:hypothetical protein